MAMGVGSGATSNQFQLIVAWIMVIFDVIYIKVWGIDGSILFMQVIGLLIWLRQILLAQIFTMFSVL